MTNPGEDLNNMFKMVAKNTKQPVDVLRETLETKSLLCYFYI